MYLQCVPIFHLTHALSNSMFQFLIWIPSFSLEFLFISKLNIPVITGGFMFFLFVMEEDQ